ncbi:MYG1 family protein [Magnetospirillum sulfuroxidans]|uniref:MYG1 family protein n=1 Tax=Magnetospirillum sulfuroxidans TaxID=611300 RepID=A0ABS5IC36_9PROT|nr:MYG1 family protein [Magnetospirillum sulfuroxidans]MBR9971955.1 MYG1 family protein [Magnetospirillum sulfuroxidans]
MLLAATHSGSFHADDVFAFAILKAATDGAVSLTRSREAAVWDAAQVVFDVGGIFNPAAGRYDHHMRDKPLRDSGEPFSSAGLIWRDYGRAAIVHVQPQATPGQIDTVWAKLDQGLLRDIDLMDNGVMDRHPGHFSALLETWNPSFVETDSDENAAYYQAVTVAEAVLARSIAHAFAAAVAQDGVAEAAAQADDPRIIVLESRLPWEEAVFDLNLTQALYVIRPAGKDWTVSAVPPERGSFAQKKPLPDAWGGLREQELASVCGVADATFCHSARFVCGAKTREGALAMAVLAAGVA